VGGAKLDGICVGKFNELDIRHMNKNIAETEPWERK
jgi:hypothetical protein